MGRMFRVISEKFDRDRPARTGTGTVSNDAIPFVEVGGPDGFITSIAAPKPVVRTQPIALVESKPVPSILPDYLSVQFHTTTPTPVIGSDIAAELVAYHFPDHAISAEYRVLRDEIRQQHHTIGPKVFHFTCARPESGTTTVLLNYAITLALESDQTKVAIVDADFDSPTIAKKLAAADHHGLTEVLGNSVPLAWAVQPTTIPRLHVVPTGASELRPAAITDLPRILTQLKQSFDSF